MAAAPETMVPEKNLTVNGQPPVFRPMEEAQPAVESVEGNQAGN
jgi:hypothetical protein